jgi:hypothetical protein
MAHDRDDVLMRRDDDSVSGVIRRASTWKNYVGSVWRNANDL